jgi:transcriptional regulator with XRE-family HTH domain
MTHAEMVAFFRTKMRSLREKGGLSQSELARRMGVRPSYVCDLESGRRVGFWSGTLLRVSRALGVAPAVLVPKKKR